MFEDDLLDPSEWKHMFIQKRTSVAVYVSL